MQSVSELVLESMSDGAFAAVLEKRARECAAKRSVLVTSFTLPSCSDPNGRRRIIFTDSPAFARWWRMRRESEGAALM